nr:uncharacterized protein LOC111422510 isoform X1 [Onthophagus taurus]
MLFWEERCYDSDCLVKKNWMSSKFDNLETRLVTNDNASIFWSDLSVAVQILLPVALIALLFSKKIKIQPTINYVTGLWPSVTQKQRLLTWLSDKIPYATTVPKRISQFWKDGSLLCTLINTVIPGACPNPQRHWKQPPIHAQALIYKYFGLEPVLTSSDFNEKALSLSDESKFCNYLISLKELIAKRTIDLESLTFTNKYIARGMGLIVGERNKTSTFYLYPNIDVEKLDDIHISIKGPYNSYGKRCLSSVEMSKNAKRLAKLRRDLEIERKQLTFTSKTQKSFFKPLFEYVLPKYQKLGDISIETTMEKDRAKISFVPKHSGMYELLLTCNDEHIYGSPFGIRVVKDYEEKIVCKNIGFVDESVDLEENKIFLKLDQNNNEDDLIGKIEMEIIQDKKEEKEGTTILVEEVKIEKDYRFDDDKEFEMIYNQNISENENEKNDDVKNEEENEINSRKEEEIKKVDLETMENQENVLIESLSTNKLDEEAKIEEEEPEFLLNTPSETNLNFSDSDDPKSIFSPNIDSEITEDSSKIPEDLTDSDKKNVTEESDDESLKLINDSGFVSCTTSIKDLRELYETTKTSPVLKNIEQEVIKSDSINDSILPREEKISTPEITEKIVNDLDFESTDLDHDNFLGVNVFEMKLKFERKIQETKKSQYSRINRGLIKKSNLDFTQSMPNLTIGKDDYEKESFLSYDDKTNEFLMQFKEKKQFWDRLVETGSCVSLNSNVPSIENGFKLKFDKKINNTLSLNNIENNEPKVIRSNKVFDRIKIFDQNFNSEKHTSLLKKTKKNIEFYQSVKNSEGIANIHDLMHDLPVNEEDINFMEESRQRFESARHYFRSIEQINLVGSNKKSEPQRSISMKTLHQFSLDNLYQDNPFNKIQNGSSLRGSLNREGMAETLASISSTESGLERDFDDENIDLEYFQLRKKSKRRKSVKSLFENLNY